MGRLLWCGVYLAVLIWSGYEPKDRLTWWLEVSPALIGLVVLAASWRSFRLTPLLYGLILLHCVVLMIGGHYTYAEVPLFDELGAALGFERNNYDMFAHFVQGFVPAIIAREILIRARVVSTRAWLNFIVVACCLALSASYELIEWIVAVLAGASSEAFLGTQGYAWDTQTDMAMALVGAIAALCGLSRLHDRQLKRKFRTSAAAEKIGS